MRASAYRAMIVAAVLAATIATFAAPAVAAHPTTTGPRRSVVADDPPSNDNFADRQALSGADGSVTADTTEATAEPGEPAHAGSAAAASVWYRYTPAKTASVEFDTCGSDFDTVLAVYTGTVLTALTPVASNDDSNNDGCEDQSLVTFTATAGVAYSIAVDGYAGDTGDAVLEWGPAPVPPANDMFANAQIISGVSGSASGSNAAATTEPGEPQHDGRAHGPFGVVPLHADGRRHAHPQLLREQLRHSDRGVHRHNDLHAHLCRRQRRLLRNPEPTERRGRQRRASVDCARRLQHRCGPLRPQLVVRSRNRSHGTDAHRSEHR